MADHSEDFENKYVVIVAGFICVTIVLVGALGVYLNVFS